MTKSSAPLIIHTAHNSARLTYVLDFVFKAKGQDYLLTPLNNLDNTTIDLAYGDTDVKAKYHIHSAGLLVENEISENWLLSFENDEWFINKKQDYLSIIFYFLSRYEEYTDKKRDQFNRYSASQSVLYKHKQLQQPWCDILVKRIWDQLGLNYAPIANQFKTILTFDIDIAWAYKHKPWWRTAASTVKEITNPSKLIERWQVINGEKQDPYDSYKQIKSATKHHDTILFFLLGDYGNRDKNHHWKNNKLQALIQSFKSIAQIGIHPSFNSFLKTEKIQEEANRLSKISGEPTSLSRQHFLRFTLPQSYRLLIENGIKTDYSMGYAEHYGFRAGTSFPFYFFDLSANSATHLKIVPFTFMDGTLKEYLNIKPIDAIRIITELRASVKSVGGQFIPLWHNHSIGNQKEWQHWQPVFESCCQ